MDITEQVSTIEISSNAFSTPESLGTVVRECRLYLINRFILERYTAGVEIDVSGFKTALDMMNEVDCYIDLVEIDRSSFDLQL